MAQSKAHVLALMLAVVIAAYAMSATVSFIGSSRAFGNDERVQQTRAQLNAGFQEVLLKGGSGVISGGAGSFSAPSPSPAPSSGPAPVAISSGGSAENPVATQGPLLLFGLFVIGLLLGPK